MNMMQTIPGKVTRRHAFFIAGYDPRGARFYHKLYKDEAAKQNRLNGLDIRVGPRQRGGEHESRWQITAADESGRIETTYHYLGWDDLVRARWPRSSRRVACRMPSHSRSRPRPNSPRGSAAPRRTSRASS